MHDITPWCKTVKGETLLHRACINGQLKRTRYLIETYPEMLHMVDNFKRTPAHHAAVRGNVSVLQYLIEQGTNPWCRTSEEETFLHTACIEGELDMTKYLVGMYPKMLYDMDRNKYTPAHHAAVSGSVDVLRYLIDHCADPWCLTAEGETLLHIACLYGQLEIAEYLVQLDPQMLHEVDNSNSTPAHHAAANGNVAVLRYILNSGANPWCRTSEEETLLHRSCIKGELEMIKYLVETYPKMLHERDKSKNTPAHYAAESGNVAVLTYLIDSGIRHLSKTLCCTEHA
ncbi:hypothetical protein ACJMK2_014068 [Sinanodonta woodiana]|uniref:Ankyrin repeat protein n=1 Tax=Sinanodonta woodiana TaxID=1069815 RepID=A0ABD3UZF6_SINWO